MARRRLKNPVITPHALDRFIERWRPLDMYDEVPKTKDEWFDKCLAMLLQSSKVSQGRVNRVLQLINHSEIASHFINKIYGLKFVVIESGDSFVVKTVLWMGREYSPEDIPTSDDGGA